MPLRVRQFSFIDKEAIWSNSLVGGIGTKYLGTLFLEHSVNLTKTGMLTEFSSWGLKTIGMTKLKHKVN